MDYDKAIRSVRGAASELSRFVEELYDEHLSPRRGPPYASLTFDVATTERDYYELLGVSRDADEAEIKKAFRGLARELHPDVSDAPDAEERFREVVEAYEVLSKPETRELYDRFGHAGLRSGGFQPDASSTSATSPTSSRRSSATTSSARRARRGAARGADVAAQVEIELVEAASGVDAVGAVPGRAAVRRLRRQRRRARHSRRRPARRAAATGGSQQVSRNAFGEFVRVQACPTLPGPGASIEHPCRDVRGRRPQASRSARSRSRSRRGSTTASGSGSRGEGHAGAARRRAGDLYVQVRVRPDPRFVREGNDLFSTVDLTMTQAALGATVTVPTLDGEIELEFDAGTQPGEVRVLRGRGMPVLQGFGRGDHRVLVNVAVPRRLTDEQRRLLEEFERAAGEDTYRADEGFFEKLKSAFR